jgi:hypothetical protein
MKGSNMNIDQIIWILEILAAVLAAVLMFRSFARLEEAKRDLRLAKQLRQDSLRSLSESERLNKLTIEIARGSKTI